MKLPINGSRRPRFDVDDGFSLIELTVALSVIMTVMLSVAFVLTSSLADTAFAKQRQTAASLANKTMEQVRALPFTTVAKGLDTTDVTNSHDSNITVSGSTFTFVNGEVIPHGNLGYTQSPLVPHLTTVSLNASTYTVGTYPTTYAGATGVYRITVIVSWSHGLHGGVSSQVSTQTLLSSPTGCLQNSTHPFAAPCQPFLYANAATGTGAIRITGVNGATGDPIGDLALNKADLDLVHADSTLQVEQISTILSQATTAGGTIDVQGQSLQTAGEVSGASKADNDPGSATNTSATTPVAQVGSIISASDGGSHPDSITLAPSTLDAGTAVATANAGLLPPCTDLSLVVLLTSLPCGGSNVLQSGPTMTANMGLYAGSTYLGSTMLGSVATAPLSTRLFTSRHTNSGGAYCAGTSGDGCVHAATQRSIGSVQLAGLPPQVLADGAAPSGWGTGGNNALIQLTNYADKVTAESGVAPAAPTAAQMPAVGVSGPTLTYWNGSGYTTKTVDWGAAPPVITIPTVTVTDNHVGANPLTVTMSATITAGSINTATVTPAGCTSVCSATATVSSPISGDIIYSVMWGSTTLANLDIHVDFGTISAQTSYRAAPSSN